MIILESILTTYEVSVIFWGLWGSSGNWLEPKTKPPLQILTKLSMLKSVICTVAAGVLNFSFHLYFKNL